MMANDTNNTLCGGMRGLFIGSFDKVDSCHGLFIA